MNYYILKCIDLPWGDWGDILWNGFVYHDKTSNAWASERVGTQVPMAYISGSCTLVLHHTLKAEYEMQNLSGITDFDEVFHKKIINLDWSRWHSDKCITNYIGEDWFDPEDLITKNRNDAKLQASLQPYWVADIIKKAEITLEMAESGVYTISSQVIDSDIFQASNMLHILVSERMKRWLDKNCPDHFLFDIVLLKR